MSNIFGNDENNDCNYKLSICENFDIKIVCNYLNCYAGVGLCGNGVCFLGGNPYDKNCKKFINEIEYLNNRE